MSRRRRVCSKCGIYPPRPGQWYCWSCHAAWNREYRSRVPLTKEQRFKMNARSYAHIYVKRGKIIKKPCEDCGNINSQIHHYAYENPLDIIWLCRPCHLKLHAKSRAAVNL